MRKKWFVHIGCGGNHTGLFKYLTEKGCEYIGFDLSFNALKSLRTKGDMHTVCGILQFLPFKDGTVIVVCDCAVALYNACIAQEETVVRLNKYANRAYLPAKTDGSSCMILHSTVDELKASLALFIIHACKVKPLKIVITPALCNDEVNEELITFGKEHYNAIEFVRDDIDE